MYWKISEGVVQRCVVCLVLWTAAARYKCSGAAIKATLANQHTHTRRATSLASQLATGPGCHCCVCVCVLLASQHSLLNNRLLDCLLQTKCAQCHTAAPGEGHKQVGHFCLN